jgi:hypothetical protein
MEDVLEVYHRPHDPEYPVVCVDETSKQLISETRVPIKAKPGQPARHDYEYERNGTVNSNATLAKTHFPSGQARTRAAGTGIGGMCITQQ